MAKHPVEMQRDEHDDSVNAKKVSIVNSTATIYAVVNTGSEGLGGTATCGNVTVAGSAIEILISDTARRSAMLRNISNTTIFIGVDNTVTTSTGTPLQRDDSMTLDRYDGPIFGIADASGHQIRFLVERD